MVRYILKKIMYGFLVLWGAITLVFFLFLGTSDPDATARSYAGKNPTPETIKEIKKNLNLDLPLHQRYLLYLNDVSPISVYNPTVKESKVYLDTSKYKGSKLLSFSDNRVLVFKYPYLGRSQKTSERVSDIVFAKLPETAILAFFAIVIGSILGILLGIITAIYKGSFIDRSALILATLGMSAPSFYIGIIIMWVGAVLWNEQSFIPMVPLIGLALGIVLALTLNKRIAKKRMLDFSWAFIGESAYKGLIYGTLIWLLIFVLNSFLGEGVIWGSDLYISMGGTGLETGGTFFDKDDYGDEFLNWKAIILPAITLGIRPLSVILQLTRSSMLDVLSQDYIRTAKAKGLSQNKVVIKHALKNALNPVVTAISGWFGSLLAGALFVEQIFNWNGLGNAIYKAILEEDVPLLIGAVIFIAIIFTFINIIVDLIYGLLDPRVRIR